MKLYYPLAQRLQLYKLHLTNRQVQAHKIRKLVFKLMGNKNGEKINLKYKIICLPIKLQLQKEKLFQ